METLPVTSVVEPRSVAEAVAAREQEPQSRYLAGGTDLLANLRRGIGEHKTLIDVRGIAELRAMSLGPVGLTLGAAVTLADVVRAQEIASNYPALVAAASAIAAPAHREAATVGGNLCLDTRCLYYNESAWWREANEFCLKYRGSTCHVAPSGERCWAAYSGDLAPALFAYRAEVEIASVRGTRRIPLEELFAYDGIAYLRLAREELVVAVHLPPDPWPAAYAKLRGRAAIDFPLVGVALARLGRRARVGVTGTNSAPVMLEFDDVAGDGEELVTSVASAISPMRTTAMTPIYRRRAAGALIRRLAKSL